MLSVNSLNAGIAVRRRKGIEHPHIKECVLLSNTPKTSHTDVQPSFVILLGRRWKAFPRQRLKAWLPQTSEQTSANSPASRSLVSLCRSAWKPPWRHNMTWSMSKGTPQRHLEGVKCNGQPYRRATASLKAPLWRANPKLLMGRADSQDDVPFSWAA